MKNNKICITPAHIAVVVTMGLMSPYANARPPTDSELARITLLTHLSKGYEAGLQASVAEHTQYILQLEQENPNKMRNA